MRVSEFSRDEDAIEFLYSFSLMIQKFYFWMNQLQALIL